VLRQLVAADLIALNKVDLVTDADAQAVASWLHEKAPQARVIRTVNARLPCDIVLGPAARPDGRDDRHRYRYRVPSAANDVCATFSTETLRCSGALSERHLRQALDALPDSVLRAKGYWSLAPAPATVPGGDSVLVLIGAAGTMRLDDSIAIVRVFRRA